MKKDASFLQGGLPGLKLRAQTAEDLQVISSLLQDALGKVSEIAWMPETGILAFSLCRFRWEEPENPQRQLCGMHFSNVTAFRAKGVSPHQRDASFALLALRAISPTQIIMECADDISFAIDIDQLDLRFHDRLAWWPTNHKPDHQI